MGTSIYMTCFVHNVKDPMQHGLRCLTCVAGAGATEARNPWDSPELNWGEPGSAGDSENARRGHPSNRIFAEGSRRDRSQQNIGVQVTNTQP